MVKFRLYYDKDKETAFLNDMSRKGYAMTGFCMGFFRFEPCTPGEYIYQIDITEGMFRVSSDYREFMQDMGVEIICLWGPWVILRKRACEGAFELYTDVESSITHYARIRTMYKGFIILSTAAMLMEFWCAVAGVKAAWAFAFFVAAILAVMLRQLMQINSILKELKGRAGGERTCDGGRCRKFSGFLVAGLLLNSVVLMLPGEGAWGGRLDYLLGFLKGFGQVMALFFLIMGCVFTLWRRGE